MFDFILHHKEYLYCVVLHVVDSFIMTAVIFLRNSLNDGTFSSFMINLLLKTNFIIAKNFIIIYFY